MLSGRATETDRVRGFARGADDYIAKPFNYPELAARIAAVLRRARARREKGLLQVGELRIDPASRDVRLGERAVELSAKEFALLHALAADPTRVFTKEELLRDVWGFKLMGSTRTLDSHASRLRRKLAPVAEGRRWVVNVWGVGYRLTDRSRLMLDALALLGAGAVARCRDAVEGFRARRLVRRLRQVALCCHELRGRADRDRPRAHEGRADRWRRPSRVRVEALRHGYDRAVCGCLRPGGGSRRASRETCVRAPSWSTSARLCGASWRRGTPRYRSGRGRSRSIGGAARRSSTATRCDSRRRSTIWWRMPSSTAVAPCRSSGAPTAARVSVCVLDRGAGLMRPLERAARPARGRPAAGTVL